MKKKLLFAGLPALMLASCSSLLIPPPLENGWYEFKSVEKMTVKNKPIALASGFRDLAIDSIPMPGMKVYAIKGMVGDPEAWKKAIKDDGIVWGQVSDLKRWESPMPELYNFSGIPHLVLVDGEGRIVAKNLRGEALRAKVAEICK